MKQLLFLLLICTSPMFASAQDPTEEATIKWITKTIETYGWYHQIDKVNVSACEISIEYTRDDGVKSKCVGPVDPDLTTGFFERSGTVYVYYKTGALMLYSHSDGDTSFSSMHIILVAPDVELGERMVKALKHLHTFCSKEDEPF